MNIIRLVICYFVAFFAILSLACNKQVAFFATNNDIEFRKGYYNNSNSNPLICNESEFYAQQGSLENEFPTKTIRINFHIFDSKKGRYNFTADSAKLYIKELVKTANYRLIKNKQMHLPANNTTPVLPIRLKFEITPDPNIINDDGIYFHTDSLWYLNKKDKRGKTGLYSPYLYDKYGVQKNKVLNILMLEHHPDSIISTTYRSSGNGLGMPYFVKMVNCYKNSKKKSKGAGYMSALFNHEVGHSLGLGHSWVKNDGCSDTPPHDNCWNYTDSGNCSKNVSNNVMDYNAFSNALTPCQIGTMHKNIMRTNASQRKITKKNWCFLDASKNVTVNNVSKATEWFDAKDLRGNLIIERGAKLVVHCRLGMPKDAKIIVKAGGTLILNNCRVYNDCNQKWKGIEIEKKRNLSGNVIFYGNVGMEDVENGINVRKKRG